MRVIRPGIEGVPIKKVKLFRIYCQHCGCLFEATEGEKLDLITERHPKGKLTITFECPQCKNEAFCDYEQWHSIIELIPGKVPKGDPEHLIPEGGVS